MAIVVVPPTERHVQRHVSVPARFDASSRPPFRVLWRESHATSAVLAALAAAVPAAVLSALASLLADALAGRDAGDTLLRVGDLVAPEARGRDVWLAALSMHLALALLWGAVWGALVAFTAHHLAPVAGAVWGAIYGVVIWLATFVLIFQWAAPALADRTRSGLLWHIVYGAVLGALFHPLRARERERHRAAAHPTNREGSSSGTSRG